MAQVELSQIWLFGTRKVLESYTYEEALDMARHTHPNGQLMKEPTMVDDDAAELLRTGKFPDAVWNYYTENKEE